jgi:hypothetical protein
MQLIVSSVQDVRGVSPPWLRPSAFGLVLCMHLVLLVGIPWPAGTSTAEPPPFEIQVIPQAEPAQPLVPLDSVPVVEVKPANALPVDVQAVEAEPLRHGPEIVELKPSESAFATNSPPGGVVSSEPQAAELKPLEVPPTGPVQAAQPARGAPRAEALAISPPGQPLSSEQQVAESEPLEVRRPTAPLQAAQPAREAPRAEASALAINPPSHPLSSEQAVAKSDPLEEGSAAALLQVAQPAHEAPSDEGSTLAISPPSQPLSTEQKVAELAPLELPQSAVPVRVGRLTLEAPVAESLTVVSDSQTHGTILSSEQQVAKLEPYSPNEASPLQDEGPIAPRRVDKIVRYVEQYDGGRCFFVAPVAVTETEAKLEGYGASAGPFEALDAAFRHENGFEASIDVRLVTPAQCPAVAFLGRLRGANAPHLRIDGVNLGPGDALTGTVDGYGSRNVELLVATDAGTVQNVSHLLKPGTAIKTFTISLGDIARASEGQPQLLIVVASPLPLDVLRFNRPVKADRLFSAALTEAVRTSQPIAAMARYFKLER